MAKTRRAHRSKDTTIQVDQDEVQSTMNNNSQNVWIHTRWDGGLSFLDARSPLEPICGE